MKLFLTSVASQTLDKFIPLLQKYPKKLKVAFIPTAGDTYKEKLWMEKDRRKLVDLGFNLTDFDLKEKTQNQVETVLSGVDIIFIAGGNTFYLLDKIKKSRSDKVIKKLVKNGKIYIGSSAGSYIASPTIEAAGWKYADKNVVGLKDLTGLNLVPFIFIAHFEEKFREDIEYHAKKCEYPIIAVTNKQAILVEDSKWEIVGEEEKFMWNF